MTVSLLLIIGTVADAVHQTSPVKNATLINDPISIPLSSSLKPPSESESSLHTQQLANSTTATTILVEEIAEPREKWRRPVHPRWHAPDIWPWRTFSHFKKHSDSNHSHEAHFERSSRISL